MDSLIEDSRIIQHEIHDEMKNSYIDYAMSVIVGRALPDVRDGMKPVHRRILYGMDRLGTTPDKPYKKNQKHYFRLYLIMPHFQYSTLIILYLTFS